MGNIYDVSNAANWELIYTGNFNAIYVQGKQVPIYTPIPKTDLGLSIDSFAIAAFATSTKYQPTSRKYVGSLIQAVDSNGSFDTPKLTHGKRSLFNNQTVFAEFNLFKDPYDLMLAPPWWIEDLSLKIWKYIGIGSNETNNRLDSIEAKVDRLLEQSQTAPA